jgi:hypothetical protein
MTTEKNTEAQLRRRARRKGLVLRKGRDENGFAGYLLMNEYRSIILIGDGFSLSLEEVTWWIDQDGPFI